MKGTFNTNNPPSEIHLSNNCTGTNCIPIPDAEFNVMLRGYSPKSSFILGKKDFHYTLPALTRCYFGGCN